MSDAEPNANTFHHFFDHMSEDDSDFVPTDDFTSETDYYSSDLEQAQPSLPLQQTQRTQLGLGFSSTAKVDASKVKRILNYMKSEGIDTAKFLHSSLHLYWCTHL
jgi:hypothetical protein